MAVGRHYRDTAPTSGVVYGGSDERMSVDVELEEIAPPTEIVPIIQTQATQQA